MAHVADDRGGDHRACPEPPGQAGPGAATAAVFVLVSRDPGIDAAQIIGEVGGELAPGGLHRLRGVDRCQEPPGLARGDLPGDAAGDQLAPYLVPVSY